MSKPKKNLEKARQIKGLGNSGLKKFFQKIFYTGFHIKKVSNTRADRHNNIADYYIF